MYRARIRNCELYIKERSAAAESNWNAASDTGPSPSGIVAFHFIVPVDKIPQSHSREYTQYTLCLRNKRKSVL